MDYYIVKESLNPEVVGREYPQAYRFVKGYDPNALNAIFSLYKYRFSFPDYNPNLDGIMFSGSAKLTDFISSSFGPQLQIISEKTKQILEQYHLCPHQFYSVGLYKRNIKQSYFMLMTIFDSYIDFVDYKKSSFVEYNLKKHQKFNSVSVNSKSELFQKKEKIKSETGGELTVWCDKIVMNKNFDREVDFFFIGRIDANLYVSERLMAEIIRNNLTGWEFELANNLVV